MTILIFEAIPDSSWSRAAMQWTLGKTTALHEAEDDQINNFEF